MSMRPQHDVPKLPDPTKNFELVLQANSGETAGAADEGLKWSDLTETEKSAASLGVDPSGWKPLTFLNEGHYQELLKTNAIGDNFAKKLEAFKVVSTGGK
jgi:hypothetical protein